MGKESSVRAAGNLERRNTISKHMLFHASDVTCYRCIQKQLPSELHRLGAKPTPFPQRQTEWKPDGEDHPSPWAWAQQVIWGSSRLRKGLSSCLENEKLGLDSLPTLCFFDLTSKWCFLNQLSAVSFRIIFSVLFGSGREFLISCSVMAPRFCH